MDFTTEDVTQYRGFYSDLYKMDNGYRPRFLSDEQLANWLNNHYTILNNEIIKIGE